MSKPKSLTNLRAGKALQRLRIEHGILEQAILAIDGCNWKENRIRDREISVASITLVEVVRLGLVFQMDPVLIARRMIAPISISLDKITTNNSDIGIWIKHGKLGDRKTWAKSIIEKDFPGKWVVYEDYKDALLFLTDSIDDVRREVEIDIREGRMKPTELVNTAHLGIEWETEIMKAQGRNLKGFRLRKGYASQWVAASKTGFNSSWQQCRESAKVSIKLEDCVSIAEAWDTSPFTLIEILLNPNPPTDQDLKDLRKKYC
jgi:hypothetical protein